MNITLCSSFRNAVPYLPVYLRQVADLDTLLYHAGHRLSFIWAEGDSTDSTQKMLHAARRRFKSTIVDATHGGPAYGSIVNVQRFAQLAYVANKVWELLPAEADVVIWAESDLWFDAQTMLALINRLEDYPAVAPMVMHKSGYAAYGDPGVRYFYDRWAFRCNGQQFTNHPPYHPAINGEMLKMDSVGSCLAMRGDVARGVYVPIEDVLVGTCRLIYENGGSVWLDPTLSVEHDN